MREDQIGKDSDDEEKFLDDEDDLQFTYVIIRWDTQKQHMFEETESKYVVNDLDFQIDQYQ